jgi:hypothetical protein
MSISDVVKLPVAALAGIVVSVLFYEGLRLPIVGQIIPGIVWYRIDAATSNMVTKFERDALASQLAEERRLRSISDAVSAKAQERADAARIAEQQALDDLDHLRTEADSDPDLSRPNARDREWLGKH